MINPSPVRRLPANTLGKDYVVGDLHGCFELLERLLKEVRFDTSIDRLFSVGDLIDRGPDSLRCLQLLDQPWFYAIQGNHESMMIDFFLNYLQTGKLESLDENELADLAVFGGEWVAQYYQPESQGMTPEFNRCLGSLFGLPLLWVVGEGQERFHVVHAELVRPNYKGYGQIVWLDSDIDGWLAGEEIHPESLDRFSWGRMLMDALVRNSAPIQEGLSITFCGHTYGTHLRQALSHLCLDTGAFLSYKPYPEDEDEDYGLTLFNVQDSSWTRASYQGSEVILSDQSQWQ